MIAVLLLLISFASAIPILHPTHPLTHYPHSLIDNDNLVFSEVQGPDYHFRFQYPVLNLDLFSGITNVSSSSSNFLFISLSNSFPYRDKLLSLQSPFIIMFSSWSDVSTSRPSNVRLAISSFIEYSPSTLFISTISKTLDEVLETGFVNTSISKDKTNAEKRYSISFNYDVNNSSLIKKSFDFSDDLNSLVFTNPYAYVSASVSLLYNTSYMTLKDFELILTGEAELSFDFDMTLRNISRSLNFGFPLKHSSFWFFLGPIPIPLHFDFSLKQRADVNLVFEDAFKYSSSVRGHWLHSLGLGYHYDDGFNVINRVDKGFEFSQNYSKNSKYNFKLHSATNVSLSVTLPSLGLAPVTSFALSPMVDVTGEKKLQCLGMPFIQSYGHFSSFFDVDSFDWSTEYPIFRNKSLTCQNCAGCLESDGNVGMHRTLLFYIGICVIVMILSLGLALLLNKSPNDVKKR
ncbi:hypothetical protein GEMRC1_003034 [Eukaryota sp. GEM-RC1]